MIEVICKNCNKLIKRQNSEQKNFFCSRECFITFIRRNKPISASKWVKCPTCGQEFETMSRTFCSKSCASKFSARHRYENKPQKPQMRIVKKCEQCGKEFLCSPSVLKRGRKFCSRSCWIIYRQKSECKIDKIGYPPRWVAISNELKEQIICCEFCGRDKYRSEVFVIHHIISLKWAKIINFEAVNDRSNFMVLCYSCHTKVEYLTERILRLLYPSSTQV